MTGHKPLWKGWTEPSSMNWGQLHRKIRGRAHRPRSSEKNASIYCVLGVRIIPMGPEERTLERKGDQESPQSHGKGFVCHSEWNGKPLRVLHRSVARPDKLFKMITLAAGWRMGCGRARETGKQVTSLRGQSQLLDHTNHLGGQGFVLA